MTRSESTPIHCNLLVKAAQSKNYHERRLSSVETPSSPSGGGRRTGAGARDEPTIRRTTAEILAALEAKKEPEATMTVRCA